MDTEIKEKDEILFPEEFDGSFTVFFGFECNCCGYKWFSTLGQCPYCQKIDFEVLNTQEAADLRWQNMLAEKIHFVFLNGGL